MFMILGTDPKGEVSTSYLSIARKGIMYELLAHVYHFLGYPYKFRSPMFGEFLLILHFPSSPKMDAAIFASTYPYQDMCLEICREMPVKIGMYSLDPRVHGLPARRAP